MRSAAKEARQAAQHSGQKRQPQRESGHRPVHLHRIDKRQARGQKITAQSHQRRRRAHAQQSAGKTQQRTFQQHLAQQPFGGRAQRQPYRNLPLIAHRSHQQQARQIRAGDQQHHRHRHQQDAQQRLRIPHGHPAQRSHHRAELKGGKIRGKTAHIRLRHSLGVGVRLLQAHPRFQPPHHGESPVACCVRAPLLRGEAHGNPQHAAAEDPLRDGEIETSRHHSDHGIRLAVQQNLFAEDIFVAAKLVLPEDVAQQHHRHILIVFLLGEDPPDYRRNTQGGKGSWRHPRGLQTRRPPVSGKLQIFLGISPHRRERVGFLRVTNNFRRRNRPIGG